MADSILGLIAQGPQRSPIQGYLKGRELKAQREERASLEKSRNLQQQRLAQIMRKEASAEELQDFFFSSVAAFSMNDEEKRKAFWENSSKKYRTDSLVGRMSKGMLDDGVSDKSLAQSIALGQGIGVLPAPEKIQPKSIDMFKIVDGRVESREARTPEEFKQFSEEGFTRGKSTVPKEDRGPLVNVNVGDAETEFAKTLGKEGAKQLLTGVEKAREAAQSLASISEVERLLKEGVITGFGANIKVGIGKALQQVGINFADDAIANTEAFVAAQSKQVAEIIQAFGAGTGLSDADREFAIKAAGGDVTMTEKSIRRILDINKRAYNNVIKKSNARASKVDPKLLPFDLTVDVPNVSTGSSLPQPAGPQGPVTVTSQTDYDQLPDGAEYTYNGVRYKKGVK